VSRGRVLVVDIVRQRDTSLAITAATLDGIVRDVPDDPGDAGAATALAAVLADVDPGSGSDDAQPRAFLVRNGGR
jgi:hypothetical protein